MTTDHRSELGPDGESRGIELTECARRAEDALRRLAHLTIDRPGLTPAEVDGILSHLAETVAAFPQVASQLSGILDRTRETHRLSVDGMTAITDPDLAIDTAQLHLDELRGPATQTYRHLNAARNQTAHISATPRLDTQGAISMSADPVRRPEDRQPPSQGGPSRGGPAR